MRVGACARCRRVRAKPERIRNAGDTVVSSDRAWLTLLSAPIELAGDWGRMLPRSADQVVERMRHSCLDGVRLLSDRQPTRLRVDEHTSGSPAVWLHPDGSSMAWIIVDTGRAGLVATRLSVRP